MKKMITTAFVLTLFTSAFGSEICTDLRFEAQDFLCTLEAKISSESVGTDSYQNALRAKMSCLDNFVRTCEVEAQSDIQNLCENIKFEAQDFLCTLESKVSSDAAGTDLFQEALENKMKCLNNFMQTCLNL